MATNDDTFGWALLGLGVGVAAAIAVGATANKRRNFHDQLTAAVRANGLGDLVNCELGRDPRGAFWHLTLQHPVRGVEAVVVRLGDLEPYSPEALQFVLDRVARWVWWRMA